MRMPDCKHPWEVLINQRFFVVFRNHKSNLSHSDKFVNLHFLPWRMEHFRESGFESFWVEIEFNDGYRSRVIPWDLPSLPAELTKDVCEEVKNFVEWHTLMVDDPTRTEPSFMLCAEDNRLVDAFFA